MTPVIHHNLTAAIPFPDSKPWLRKAIASLYSHSGMRIPLHLLPEATPARQLNQGDRE
jgi:hypothetical protein